MAKKNDDFENLAQLVALGSTVREAAEQIGISESVAYRYSATAEFKARVAVIRTEKTEGLSGQALGGAEEALIQLRAIASTAEKDSDRIAACKILLDKAISLAEMTELRRRLDEIERRDAIEKSGQGSPEEAWSSE